MAEDFFQTSLGLRDPVVTSSGSSFAGATSAPTGAGSGFSNALAAASFGLDLMGTYDQYRGAQLAVENQRRFAEMLAGFEPDLVEVPDFPEVDVAKAIGESTQSLLDGIAPATQAAAEFNDFVRNELESVVPGISKFLATASQRSDELLQTRLTDLDAGPSDLRRRIVAETVAARQPAGGAPFNDLLVTSLVDTTLQENLARRAEERSTLALGQSLGAFSLTGAQTLAPFSGTEFLSYTAATSSELINLAFRENAAKFSAALNAEIANSALQTELGLAQLQADAAGSATVRQPTALSPLGMGATGAIAGAQIGGAPGAVIGAGIGILAGSFFGGRGNSGSTVRGQTTLRTTYARKANTAPTMGRGSYN